MRNQLAEADWGHGTWSSDGSLIYTPSYASGLHRVSNAGGVPEVLTTLDAADDVLGHWWPDVLPGGHAVLFTVFGTPLENSDVAVLSLETGEWRSLLEGANFARYSTTGHVLFVRGTTLMAAPFDAASLEITGPAVPVLEDVPLASANGHSHYAVSDGGTLAYLPASMLDVEQQLVWIDRTGNEELVADTRRRYAHPRLSADGQRVALSIDRDVWIHELTRDTLTRLTFGETNEVNPLWTPDDRRLVFKKELPIFDLFWGPSDGSTEAEPLVTSGVDKVPLAFTPDGQVLMFGTSGPVTRQDIWTVRLGDGHEPEPLITTEFSEGAAVFSPDGGWVVYHSDESGQFEVYVQAYPELGAKLLISPNGGTEPLWSRNGEGCTTGEAINSWWSTSSRTIPA